LSAGGLVAAAVLVAAAYVVQSLPVDDPRTLVVHVGLTLVTAVSVLW
jgi:hypothetical protein